MMITIKVISCKGQPPVEPASVDFDEQGGSIGRRESNDLVLRDPAQLISREQARVLFRNGRFELLDQGKSPTLINGRALGSGQLTALRSGDELQIGDYRLAVVDTTQAQGISPAPLAPAAAPGSTSVIDDPLGLFAGGVAPSAGSANPFADLLGEAGSAPPTPPTSATPEKPPADIFADLIPRKPGAAPTSPAPAARSGAPAASAGRAGNYIPDDFDPFADPFAERPQAAPEAGVAVSDGLDLGPIGPPREAGGGSLDALFDLRPEAATDPFADSPLGEKVTGQNTAADGDVLASLGAVRPLSADPVPDRVAEIHAPFVPPKTWRDESPASPARAPDDVAHVPAELPAAERVAPGPGTEADADFFLSWQSESLLGPSGISSATFSSSEAAALDGPHESLADAHDYAAEAAPRATAAVAGFEDVRGPLKPPHSAAPVEPPAGELAAKPATASADELLDALRAGLGLPELPLPQGLSVELMERMGCLLREATQGTLDLLLARAATKREVRAEVTVISARDNNPLKFSPDVTLALGHLMAPQGHGFLPPVEAMRDAYEDLRAHQFGFMAGLRAALADVLGRFDPQTLETRLTQKTVLDSLLPMNRRARLWDLYITLYSEIAAEAEDDFHTLFGREFLRAYQEQVARLASDKDRS